MVNRELDSQHPSSGAGQPEPGDADEPSGLQERLSSDAPHVSFWRIVGAALGAGLLVSLIYTLIVPGFSGRAWSDALCTAALFVALGGTLPLFLDTGRGVAILGKLGRTPSGEDDTQDAHRRIWREEHRKRERGITITFALAFAALLIGAMSVVASLW
jgi:hypothetical protein